MNYICVSWIHSQIFKSTQVFKLNLPSQASGLLNNGKHTHPSLLIPWSLITPINFYKHRVADFIWIKLCRYEYRWADGVQIKKPIEVSAPKYVEYLMDWIEAQLDDESIFPQKLGTVSIRYFGSLWSCGYPELLLGLRVLIILRYCIFVGTPFPPNFKEVVKTIFKRLFRVYAHIYHSHFQKIVSLKEEAHLNTCFKHFILFTCVSRAYDHPFTLSGSYIRNF